MANLYEITRYKAQLMKLLCTSDSIAELLKMEDEPLLQGQELVHKKVFPYLHKPDTNETATAFICYEVNVPRTQSDNIKTVSIDINVVCHQSVMRLHDGRGMRIDVLAAEVDRLLNGNEDYGIGGLSLINSEGFNAIGEYYGRASRYYVKDFNRNLCGDDVIADWT